MTRTSTLLCLVVLHLSGCAIAPFDYPREPSWSISPSSESQLKDVVDAWKQRNAGPSGFYPLLAGRDALGARLSLIDLAEKSIDAQYFLMKGDTAGLVFAGKLLEAADRGVRIRFLLDDVFTTVADDALELLDAHPNIELRLYNPVSRRGIPVLNFLSDFKRANRRMHNKSMTVDSQVTIVGGRNIADEYFELRPEVNFLDLDVLGVGPIAAKVGMVFDEFWNDERSLPIGALASKPAEHELAQVREDVQAELRSVGDSVYREAVGSKLVRDLFEGRQPLYSAEAEVITDNPSKLTAEISDEHLVLVKRLSEVVMAAETEVIVLTPYFVPDDDGLRFWESLVDKGVRVVLFTNSLSSTNHIAVHSAYAGYRKRILATGIELYETRADAVDEKVGPRTEALTLHTKGMIMDRKRVFIGSLNLDPRSIDINSEMGLLIQSAPMSLALAEAALDATSALAYRVGLDGRGGLQWRGTVDGVEVVESSEPLASVWRRFLAFLLKVVPNSQL